MKKFILLAMIGIASAIYQPVKAQISLNVNIGNAYQPYHYYSRPVVYRTDYVPVKRYVYVDRHHPKAYKTYYARPAYRHQQFKKANYRSNVKYVKHNRFKSHNGKRH